MSASRSPRRKLLRATVSQQRRRLAISSALFVSHQVGEVLVPVAAGLAIDRAVVTSDGGALARWLVVLAAIFAVLSTSWRWADRFLTAALEDAAHRLRLRVTSRFVDDEGVAGAPAAGQVVSVVSSDVDAAVRVLVAVAAGIASAAALMVAAVILLVLSRPLGALVLVGLPLAVVALQVLTGPLERRADKQRSDAARAAALATDLLTGLRVLKGMRAESAAAERYRTASRRALSAGLSATRFGAVHEGGTVLTTGAFVAIVALVAGRLAADGDMTIGALVAAIGVTQFLVGPLWRLGFAGAELAKARASAGRVAVLLDAPPRVVDGDGNVTCRGSIALRRVRHRSLREIDVEVDEGAFIAIAALDPADAAVIVDLLARREDPSDGHLELDGAAFPTIRLERLREEVVVARHDAALFSGTVLDNIAVVGSACGGDDVDELLVAVGADDLHHSLAQGINTPVAARGTSLSGGQRQRIALARALAADPRILVLHDPTTAVDAVTEAAAATGLRARRAHRTTIVVATSPALLEAADEVVVIADGAVVDRGSHRALLARNALYASVVLS